MSHASSGLLTADGGRLARFAPQICTVSVGRHFVANHRISWRHDVLHRERPPRLARVLEPSGNLPSISAVANRCDRAEAGVMVTRG